MKAVIYARYSSEKQDEYSIEGQLYDCYEYAKKKRIHDIPAKLQEIIDEYNKTAPVYKRILDMVVRETEFEKNTSKKIKRH